ncbi:numb-like protein isoform X2 [Bombina bombina]|nr:numb-like protein isoform X2 [Bombina bombina]
MNKLRQSLRRKKPTYVPEASRPHQWGADEESVRRGKCSFPVRYLGHVEVDESRGMHVCEEAVKKLKTLGKKSVKAILWVSADGLRVVDEKTKDLIVDQTIEKVSFCAPDRNFDKAFSYICRDGTTRRWICHCFMALKDSGERLSHAVGCAFAACLERKQKREKECGVTASFDASRTSFAREGSFRVTSASQQAEREEVMRQLQDKKKTEAASAQSATAAIAVTAAPSPVLPTQEESQSPTMCASVPSEKGEAGGQHAIPRRHAPLEQLVRQGSFRGFPALSQKNSPFKRQLSLRLNELPSTLQRKTNYQDINQVSDLDPSALPDSDGINDLCNQINSSFANKPPEDRFTNSNGTRTPTAVPAIPPPPQTVHGAPGWAEPALTIPPPSGFQMGHRRTPSEAERWLEEVAKAAKAQQQQQQQQPQPHMVAVPMSVPTAMQAYPVSYDASPAPVGIFIAPHMQPAYVPVASYTPALGSSLPYTSSSVPVVGITPSQMVANVFCSATQAPSSNLANKSNPFPHQSLLHSTNVQNPTSSQSSQLGPKQNGTANGTTWPPDPSQLRLASTAQEVDQFEAQWAALESKSQQRIANPFSNELHKTFQIEL